MRKHKKYRDTGIQGYRDTGIQGYRDTGISNKSVILLRPFLKKYHDVFLNVI